MPRAQLLTGDALTVLRTLPAASVRCCITSPPYWGLRDYGTATWEGGDASCSHLNGPLASPKSTLAGYTGPDVKLATGGMPFRHECGKCGARRIDSQLGLERTPEEYVARLVEVFREVRRVLTDDGTLWLNLGDSYAAQRGGTTPPAETLAGGVGGWTKEGARVNRDRHDGYNPSRNASAIGLKHKDLCGIPWSVAFALRADGWFLRSEIIWSKPNPMPESVTDRPTKAHEQIFLLSKRATYFYDASAIAEPCSDNSHGSPNVNPGWKQSAVDNNQGGYLGRWTESDRAAGRNARTVWTIPTTPYPGSHFAVFPEELARRCILAGTSQRGHCPECGKPWERVVDYGPLIEQRTNPGKPSHIEPQGYLRAGKSRCGVNEHIHDKGWAPTCDHNLEPVSDVVLDPFSGSGTVASVAVGNGRAAIGIELNPKYQELALHRIGPLLASVEAA